MSETITLWAEWSAAIVEVIGIVVITGAALYVLAAGAVGLVLGRPRAELYRHLRTYLGRGILLGLEFLVAADIIHTVAVELTLRTLGVLAVVVAIRTFLSFTLELELNGRWPWQRG